MKKNNFFLYDTELLPKYKMESYFLGKNRLQKYNKKKTSLKNNLKRSENLSLVGKNKNEIVNIFGEGINAYSENIWHYVIHKTWYGRSKVLYLEFENDIVTLKSIIYI